jgi:hypothetical protein
LLSVIDIKYILSETFCLLYITLWAIEGSSSKRRRRKRNFGKGASNGSDQSVFNQVNTEQIRDSKP